MRTHRKNKNKKKKRRGRRKRRRRSERAQCRRGAVLSRDASRERRTVRSIFERTMIRGNGESRDRSSSFTALRFSRPSWIVQYTRETRRSSVSSSRKSGEKTRERDIENKNDRQRISFNGPQALISMIGQVIEAPVRVPNETELGRQIDRKSIDV